MGDMSREPSMEDILSSIRRVIARDEAPGGRDSREDVLELSEAEDEHDAEPAPAGRLADAYPLAADARHDLGHL